jgi:dihydroorotase/N-acyl-D-amino-acid deacylase
VLVEPHLPSKIFQGITTELTGEGGSIAPLNDAIVKADKVDYDHFKIVPDWRTFAQYFARIEKQRLGINTAHLVGATQVREAMRQGAFGLSTSLQYPPALYARRRN